MNADVKLTGYDKRTEFLSVALCLPDDVVNFARQVAGVPATDPDVLGVYPLSPQQAAQIAGRAGLPLDVAEYDYCLEAIARDDRPQAHIA
jgi:hypothetical protein